MALNQLSITPSKIMYILRSLICHHSWATSKNRLINLSGIFPINIFILKDLLFCVKKPLYRPVVRLMLAVCVLGLFSPLTQAESTDKPEKWYELEVIVFANTDKSLLETEEWPEKPGSPNIKHVLDLFTPTELLFEDLDQIPMYYVEPLVPGEDNLNTLVKKIQKAPEYQLLMHHTWRQTVSRQNTLPPVYLDDNLTENLYQPLRSPDEMEEETTEDTSPEQLLLEALLAEEEKINQQTQDTPFFIHELDPIVPFDELEGLPQTEHVELFPMGPPNHLLFGTLKLFKNRFMHIAIDFLHRPEPYEPVAKELPLEEIFPMITATPNEEEIVDQNQLIKTDEILTLGTQEKPPLTGFRLKASKRIRLKEIHYFDHPLFGVIVRVIPYEQPEEEIESDAPADDAAF
ncbi:MAG TPA: hypothetical protein ENJ28_05655 [Gammaproteobacteria bacterium]|nr:hypothetical protein [Gammaproteobacteria bacterium]